MKDSSPDRDLLISALEVTIPRWAEWKSARSVLSQFPPDQAVLHHLVEAIENCEVFNQVRGHWLFSGSTGFILTATSLAAPLLYRAAPRNDPGAELLSDAVDWLIRLLATRHADGKFIAAIWGITVDHEVEIDEGLSLIPFDLLADSTVKRRVLDAVETPWDGTVWMSHRYHGRPTAALVRRVVNIPYIISAAKGAEGLAALEVAATATLAFLQACIAGQALVAGCWFEHQDRDLDIKEYENYLTWLLPEILPYIRSAVSVDVHALARDAAAFRSLQSEWRSTLMRSMERFVLSQCRHQIIDQALDLALAFEIAVTGGQGDDAPKSWKASVRSAQTIGGTLQRRAQIRAAVAAVFRLRNTGIHGGSLKGSEQLGHRDTLARGASVYRELVSILLSYVKQPIWQTLELEPRTRE